MKLAIVAASLIPAHHAIKCWTCNASSMDECKANGVLQNCGENAEGPGDDYNDYVVVPSAGLNFNDAQYACVAQYGGNLFVPNDRDEFQYVTQLPDVLAAASVDAFWIGLQEFDTMNNSTTVSINGVDQPVFTQYSKNEPNDQLGEEECVRMQNDGYMNDALCDRTWAGPKNANIPMGYICEIEVNSSYRKRRDVLNDYACQVEYRSRKGAVEQVSMTCKQEHACNNNKKQNFIDWRLGKWATQCRPERWWTHSVCRQCCTSPSGCFDADTDFTTWKRTDWRALL